jgi:hypothetical protein
VLYSHNRNANVSPFLDSLGAADSVTIVTAAIAYNDEITAKTYILFVHQALYFGDKPEHNLLNPFQCRLNGVNIKEFPRILSFLVTVSQNLKILMHFKVYIISHVFTF